MYACCFYINDQISMLYKEKLRAFNTNKISYSPI